MVINDLTWVKEVRVEMLSVFGDENNVNEALKNGWKLICIKSEAGWNSTGEKESHVITAVLGR